MGRTVGKVRYFIFILFLLRSAAVVLAEGEYPWSFIAGPLVETPLGADSDVFGPGLGVLAGASWNPGFFGMTPGLYADYSYSSVGEYSLSNFSAALNLSYPITLSPAWNLSPYLRAGGYLSFFNQQSELGAAFPDDSTLGAGFLAAGGLQLDWRLRNRSSIVLDIGYRARFGLSQILGISLAYSYGFGSTRGVSAEQGLRIQPLSSVSLQDISLKPVFPVFYKHYDQNPVGTVRVVNSSGQEITNVKVSLFSRQFMDDPKTCAGPLNLAAGESAEYSLLALFNPRVLELTEQTRASGVIAVEFQSGGVSYRNEIVESLRFEDRNAVTWDDDRKVAAFVSVKDPDVLAWARVSSGVSGVPGSSVDRGMAAAVSAFEMIRLASIRYSADPTTPYREFSARESAVDYLQFPRQTLLLKSGDCDDLSVLYAALLETVGVSTAFITVPGHIYTAVAMDGVPESVRRTFRSTADFIESEGRLWVPVEVTALDRGFDEAWRTGARQWREHYMAGNARIWPVAQAWTVYEPVGLGPGDPVPRPPDGHVIRTVSAETWQRILDREYMPQVSSLEAVTISGGPRSFNSLGILHARFGFLEEAEMAFQKAVRTEPYAPALVNLGNIALIRGMTEDAHRYYDRAATAAPKNAAALLGLARASQLLENYGSARRAYDQLSSVDPALAARYAYLAQAGQETARAAEAQRARRVDTWSE